MNGPRSSPERRLLELLSALGRTEASNRLMHRSDRELAISVLSMDRENRETLLSYLGSAKRDRVVEELRFVERLGLRYMDYRRAVEGVILDVSEGGNDTLRSYIRPRGRDST